MNNHVEQYVACSCKHIFLHEWPFTVQYQTKIGVFEIIKQFSSENEQVKTDYYCLKSIANARRQEQSVEYRRLFGVVLIEALKLISNHSSIAMIIEHWDAGSYYIDGEPGQKDQDDNVPNDCQYLFSYTILANDIPTEICVASDSVIIEHDTQTVHVTWSNRILVCYNNRWNHQGKKLSFYRWMSRNWIDGIYAKITVIEMLQTECQDENAGTKMPRMKIL